MGVVLAVKRIGAGRRWSGERLYAAAPGYPDVEQVVLVGGDGVVWVVFVYDGQLLPSLTEVGTAYAMFEMTIWLSAG